MAFDTLFDTLAVENAPTNRNQDSQIGSQLMDRCASPWTWNPCSFWKFFCSP